MPNTMPQAPNARPRAAPEGNCCDSTATWQISMAPAAMPCTQRAAISTAALPAQPHSSEAAPNRARLASNKRLRPYRSASVPVAISTVVQAMV